MPPRAARLNFWLLAALLALVGAAKPILYDTLDPDLFWHLRVADQLQQDGIRPLVDHLSFSSSQSPWTPYSWLAELAMKWLWDHAGWQGAVAAHAALNASFVLLLAAAAHQATRPPSPASNISPSPNPPVPLSPCPLVPLSSVRHLLPLAAALFLSLPYLSFRPATLAIVLLAGAMALIQYDQRRHNRSRLIWLLIPLTTLLANIHLFAFLIPLWFAALLAAPWLDQGFRTLSRYAGTGQGEGFLDNPPQPTSRLNNPTTNKGQRTKDQSQIAILFLATLAAACCTPLLPGVLGTLFHYQFQDPMVASPVLAEMQPFYRGPFGLVSAALVLAWLCPILRHPRRLGLADWLLLALALALLFMKGRYAPLFAITATPLLARAAASANHDAAPARSAIHNPQSAAMSDRPAFSAGLAVLLVALLLRLIWAFPSPSASLETWLNRHGPDTPGYPVAAARYIDQNIRPRSARLINEFTWGGYLAWRLPRFQTFMDGRTQCFPDRFWRQTCLASPEARDRFLATIDADAALVPLTNSLFARHLLSRGWRPVHIDDRAQVLVPPASLAHTDP